jgi:excisionase family DNA binding protein
MRAMHTITNKLLNTKQAAQLLNVSEISIRRWTESGKLPCMRVGGRRERRFNKQDLVGFLEEQSNSELDIKKTSHVTHDSKILLEGMSIDYGNHICSLYETNIGRTRLSVPFLADGLRTGDKCFLIASKPIQEEIIHQLVDVYPDTLSAITSGRLVLSDGKLSSTDLYNYFEQQFLNATRRGEQYMRVLGDMGWAVDKGMSIDDLMDFEMRYNHSLGKKFAVVSLCQYDARKFAGTAILNVLKNHKDTFQFPLSRLIGF